MRHEMNLSQAGERATGSVKHVKVTMSGGIAQVIPDRVRIYTGDSVQWHFHGVQDGEIPGIKFVNLGVSPFESAELLQGTYPDPMSSEGLVYTLTGQNADEKKASYEYEAGVTVMVSGAAEWIGVDPVIDNEGKPPGGRSEHPEHPEHPDRLVGDR